MIRRTLRFAGKASLGVGMGTAALFVPPIEELPKSLRLYRVTCEGFGRMLRCAGVGIQSLYLFKWEMRGKLDQQDWDDAHELTATRLVEAAQKNGAVYIKICQNFASNSHILKPQYTRILKKCQEDNIRRPIKEVLTVLEEDLGCKVDEAFVEFDRHPVAAASLAQVHKAKVRLGDDDSSNNNKLIDVAVKVRYIDIEERFAGDFNAILVMLKVTGWLFPGFDFGKLVRDGEEVLRGELDFAQEARNLERMNADLAKEFGSRVSCPRVVHKVSSKRVLVTEWVDGCRADDYEYMQKHGISVYEASQLFSQAFGYQLFTSGLLHADPHAGNLRVRKNATTGKTEVVMFDLGLIQEIPERERHLLAEVWTACATGDFDGLKRVMQKLKLGDNPSDLEVNVFGSMFLQYPFNMFSMESKTTSKDVLQAMHDGQEQAMPIVTSTLEKCPYSFAIALRNISTYRAVQKNFVLSGRGACNRVAEMLKYSIVTSRGDTTSWLGLKMIGLKLWWEQWKTQFVMSMLAWWNPQLKGEEVFDEMLVLA